MAKAATNATYNGVELLIYSVIHKFVRKYGGAFEDYLLDAHEIFMYACGRHCKEKGKFSTYLTFLLNCLLVERIEKEAKFRAHLKQVDADLTLMAKAERADRLTMLTDELSDDAKTVVKLALDIPADVRLTLARVDRNPTNFDEEIRWGKSIRHGLVEFLEDLGWSMGRINRTFKEIQEAL